MGYRYAQIELATCRLRALFAALVVSFVTSPQCSSATAPTTAAEEGGGHVRVVEWFSIANDGDAILLPVTIRGKEYAFLWDTGASSNFFDESLKSLLGKRLGQAKLETSADDVLVECFAPPPACVGKLKLPVDRPVGCIDLSRACQVAGRRFDGVLGRPFHEKKIVQIDFDAGKLQILDGQPLQSDEAWGESVPLFRDRLGRPCIMGSVGENIRSPFLLDTGHNATGSLTQPFLDELAALSRFEWMGEALAVSFGGGTMRRSHGRLGSFSVGPFHHQDLVFGAGRDNTLGLSYLSRYRVTFDFVSGKMYLKKGRRFSVQDYADMSGLYLLQRSGRVEVVLVDPGSPADVAGIRPNDVIVEFQHRPASEIDLFTIRRALQSADGERITMTIDRAGKEIEVTFRLEERLPQSNAPKLE
jgi:hypothetical protein